MYLDVYGWFMGLNQLIFSSLSESGRLSGYDLVAKNAGRLRIAARAVDVVDVEECHHPKNGGTVVT